MATPNKVTAELQIEILRRWNQGERQKNIAIALGLHVDSIRNCLRKTLKIETPEHWQGGRVSIPKPKKERIRPEFIYPDNPPLLQKQYELSEGEAARFWNKVAAPNKNGCRLWLASIKPTGEGQFGTVESPSSCAYRVAWRLTYGPIPEGMQINHRCDVRACNEPTHLWLGTQADNLADMAAKGRRLGKGGIRGEENVTAKLTWEIVREIRRVRETEGLTIKALSKRFNISQAQVCNITNHRQWIEPTS